jgi:hypothetical protein
MRLRTLLTTALLVISACKCTEHSASRVVTSTDGESIKISASSLDDTSIKWAAHGVGWETKRGFVLSMSVGDRPAVVLERLSDAEQAPTEAEVKLLISQVQPSLSPDGQHLRVVWKSTKAHAELFHLLPKGSPFQLDLPGHKLPTGDDLDWSKLPNSEKLASDALAQAAKAHKDCRVPGQHYFWDALYDAVPGTALEGPVLDLWPECFNARLLVINITRNRPAVSAEWKTRLKTKLDKCLLADSSDHDFLVAVSLLLSLNQAPRLTEVEARLISLWPSDDKLQRRVMESFDAFPEKVKAAWIDKAMGGFESFEQQARIYRVMKKWSDCETFKAFGMAHPGIEQKRDDCADWPLKSFPSAGDLPVKLDALVTEGKRNEAIMLVRRNTGWEYTRAVDFVDAKLKAK